MKVLILDDHPAMNHVVESAVRKTNPSVDIISCTDLLHAKALIKNLQPAFVITDIQIFGEKQIVIPELCNELLIPYMVYTSHLNISVYRSCVENNVKVFISKSSMLSELEVGVKNLFNGNRYNCSSTTAYLNRNDLQFDIIPKVKFSHSELPVIIGHIRGYTTIQIANEMKKSKHTVRNQRINLMHRNDCSMEEIARRYLYWYSEG